MNNKCLIYLPSRNCYESMVLTNSYLYMHRKNLAFSMAEVVITILIITGIFLLALRFFVSDKQSVFDAKYNKAASSISANIEKDLITSTGFNFIDYNANNNIFQKVVQKNLNKDLCDINSCWSNNKNFNFNGVPFAINDDDYNFFKLNDETVIAISKIAPEIIIDTNGKKGPNKLDKDIRVYNYPVDKCTFIGEAPNDEFVYSPREHYCLWERTNCKRNDIKDFTEGKCLCKIRERYTDNDDPYHLDKENCIWSCAKDYNKNNFDNTIDETSPNIENGCRYDYQCKSDVSAIDKKSPVNDDGTYKCLCNNRNDHTNTDYITWTLNNNNCNWTCSTSQTDPGNTHNYYELNSNTCEWELKKECLSPYKLNANNTNCICENITTPSHDNTIVSWTENSTTCKKVPHCNPESKLVGNGTTSAPYKCCGSGETPSGNSCICNYTGGCTTEVWSGKWGKVGKTKIPIMVDINCCTANLEAIAIYAYIKHNTNLLVAAVDGINRCEQIQQNYINACPHSN